MGTHASTLRYLAQRLLQALGVVAAIALITFVMLNVVPGDPVRIMLGDRATEEAVAQVRHQMGLDRPLTMQFASWVGGLLRGDLGTSYSQHRAVSELMTRAFGHTLRLAAGSFALAVAVGLTAGIVAAISRGSWLDRLLMACAVAGISAPAFWVAIMLQLGFALRLGWLPLSGVTRAHAYVLPTAALGVRYAASIARVARTSLLEVMGEDYLRTAVAKGLSRRAAVLRHGLRNALVPIVTIAGTQLGDILAGSVVVESVFGIPGMGTMLVKAIGARDLPLIEGGVMYVALCCVAAYLLTDILYALIDPRVRLGEGAGG